ncbi:hypothetical protein J31TS4_31730 [Paenibacillus sp. J31TS4]|nr:hypothetical protein J31TS4_31730 [Paenibacillus sp. J31TS4]
MESSQEKSNLSLLYFLYTPKIIIDTINTSTLLVNANKNTPELNIISINLKTVTKVVDIILASEIYLD